MSNNAPRFLVLCINLALHASLSLARGSHQSITGQCSELALCKDHKVLIVFVLLAVILLVSVGFVLIHLLSPSPIQPSSSPSVESQGGVRAEQRSPMLQIILLSVVGGLAVVSLGAVVVRMSSSLNAPFPTLALDTLKERLEACLVFAKTCALELDMAFKQSAWDGDDEEFVDLFSNSCQNAGSDVREFKLCINEEEGQIGDPRSYSNSAEVMTDSEIESDPDDCDTPLERRFGLCY